MTYVGTKRHWVAAGVSALLASVAPWAHSQGVAGQGTWETTLQGRDLDGNLDNGFEAYYDTVQNLTWLADANIVATRGVSASGSIAGHIFYLPDASFTATGFASAANLYGIEGWVLPKLELGPITYVDYCSDFYVCGRIPSGRFDVLAGSSQLQHLMEVTLGNRSAADGSYALKNTGPFQNVVAGAYWSSTFRDLHNSNNDGAWGWAYNTSTGGHSQIRPYQAIGYVWLVHEGDVGAVPEPQSVAMWVLGLLAVFGAVVRRKGVVRQ